jgi:glutamine synthetase
LPTSLGAALDALVASPALVAGFGTDLVQLVERIKRSEVARHAAADDALVWERREYFGRY